MQGVGCFRSGENKRCNLERMSYVVCKYAMTLPHILFHIAVVHFDVQLFQVRSSILTSAMIGDDEGLTIV